MPRSTTEGIIDFAALGERQRTTPLFGDIYSKGSPKRPTPYATRTFADVGLAGFPALSRNPAAIARGMGKSNQNDKYNLLSLTKNPAIKQANDAAMAASAGVNSANETAFQGYLSRFNKQQQQNRDVNNQEAGAVNSFFDGSNLAELGKMRKDYGDQAGTEITSAEKALANQRQGYFDNSKGQIDNFSATLAKQLASYDQRTNQLIGKSESDLAAQRGNFRSEAQRSIDDSITDLADQRGRYESRATGQIGDAEKKLAATRNTYANTANSENAAADAALREQRERYRNQETNSIAKEIEDRRKLAEDYKKAAEQSTELAIDDADKVRKAQEMGDGATGGSSYFGRMAMGDRIRANAALQNQLAAVNREDFGITRAQQAGLGSRLYGDERGDTTMLHGERTRINEDLANRERSDVGMIIGQKQRLTEDVANRERSDYGFTRGREDALIENAANRERADYSYIDGRRANLNETLSGRERENASIDNASRTRLTDSMADRERSDYGMTHGERLRLNEDMANRARSDYGYVTDNSVRLLGQRQRQADQTLQNELLPIQTRNALNANRWDNLGRAQAVDAANTYYGIDDGEPNHPPIFGVGGGGSYPTYRAPVRQAPVSYPVRYGDSQPAAQPAPQRQPPVRRTVADELYKRNTGVYPDEDPNYSEDAMAYATRTASMRPQYTNSYGGGGTQDMNLPNDFDYGSEETRRLYPQLYVPGWNRGDNNDIAGQQASWE